MKWVAIALALLLLASGIFWLGRTTTPSGTPSGTPSEAPSGAPAASTQTPEPAKTAVPTPEPQAAAPDTQAAAPMDAAPASEPTAGSAPSAPPKPKPKTLAELDTGTLIQRAISAENRCSDGQGSLDQTGQACAMRDRIEAILNARGFCSSGGSANWQRCAQ